MMPDVGAKLKRPQSSAFGEGTVKRARNDTRVKPKSSDGRPADARAILSGARDLNSGFCIKSVSLPASGQRPQRPPPNLPLDQSEALSAFNTETPSKGKAPARVKFPPFVGPRPPLPLPDSDHAEPQKKLVSVGAHLNLAIAQAEKRTNSILPLMSRVRPPELRAPPSRLAAPARKVVPFHALPIPLQDESLAGSSSSLLKPLLPLKCDLDGQSKTKLTTMTALEPPALGLLEEKEAEGEALELRRGLLVSPEKGERKRRRFIRGGLAECAQVFMNRSSTSLTLWKKEIESSASRPERLRPDLRLRVKDVLQFSRNENVHSRSVGTLRSVLALCQLPDGEARSVLFSFATDGHMSHASGSLLEGMEVLVWKPWQEVAQPPTLFCSRFLVLSKSS